MVSLTFLGTGGGRFATIYQTRSTGGIIIEDKKRIHLDPGPGALTNMSHLGLDPARTDAIVISHCHPDHYSDAEVLVEGMTCGCLNRRGYLIGSKSVIHGIENIRPALSEYHSRLPLFTISMVPGDEHNIAGIRIRATSTRHTDPSGIGLVFYTSAGTISYMGDTDPHPSVVEEHIGSRILVLNVTRPFGARLRCHLCSEDVPSIIEKISPELTVMTHMGVKMIEEGPEKQALQIEEITGHRVVAARDLMRLEIGKDIVVR